jgi:predicted nucleic acid-binding protein
MKLPYQTVFVDTSFLIALLRSNDSDHAKALALYQQVKAAKIRRMTNEYVLLELGNVCLAPFSLTKSAMHPGSF